MIGVKLKKTSINFGIRRTLTGHNTLNWHLAVFRGLMIHYALYVKRIMGLNYIFFLDAVLQ